jgi:hypothetical protein
MISSKTANIFTLAAFKRFLWFSGTHWYLLWWFIDPWKGFWYRNRLRTDHDKESHNEHGLVACQ